MLYNYYQYYLIFLIVNVKIDEVFNILLRLCLEVVDID
jgi:hypothetical protein